jgi:beta-mannosidase
VRPDGDGLELSGLVRVTGAQRWWPHTHGEPFRYPVSVDVGGSTFDLGWTGFRTVSVDRTDGAFTLCVNGVEIFCRGATWFPPDPVSMAAPAGDVRATLELARRANLNMLRIPGTGVYEDQVFWDACDELGLLVWQECMLAFLDPPDDPAFTASLEAELEANLGPLARHPALAVLCGSQEVEEVAAMMGLPRAELSFPALDATLPEAAARLLPGVPYVRSNPTGGDLPFRMDAGVSQYFGVGGYLRTLEDVRRSGVRFAAECLAYATPPEPSTVDEACGGATRANHDPEWKLGVHHDAGRSWDMDDVRDYYERLLFGVDPLLERYVDPERALELGRATNAELMARVFTEWRSPESGCAGGLVLALRDLRPGAGWGLIDGLGRPKAPWFALRRVFAPVAALVTDEGLNGLRLHVVNDLPTAFEGHVRADLFARGELLVETSERPVTVPARGACSLDVGAMFDGFRDLTYAFRFGPPQFDVIAITLADGDNEERGHVVHLPLGLARALEPDVGLRASCRPVGERWLVSVTTRRFAEFVALDVPGFVPTDSWFHLPPGATREIELRPAPGGAVEHPRGHVRALNTQTTARLRFDPVSP